MKKVLALLVSFMMSLVILCACGKGSVSVVSDSSEELSSEEMKSMVASAEESVAETMTSSSKSQTETSSEGSNSSGNTTGVSNVINAPTPKIAPKYPLTKRDSMISGTPVLFDTGVAINIHASDKEFDFFIAKSYDELKAIFNSDSNENNYNYIQKYDEAFFENKALVVLFLVEGSGSYSHNIELVKDGSVLCAGIKRFVPGAVDGEDIAVTCDMAYWRYLLEVDREDVSDVKSLEYCFQ